MPIDRSIDTLLSDAQLAIDNALNNPKVLQYLSDFGYTKSKIQQGKQLYSAAAAAQLAQQAEAGGQISATTDVNEAWETAKKSYMRFLKVARVAFKRNSGVATQLNLGGTRKKSLSGWMAQAQQFYKNALGDQVILSELKEFGITEPKLKAGLAELAVIEQAESGPRKRERRGAGSDRKERCGAR